MWDVEFVSLRYPTDYYESGNTVLVQEVQRYNNLLQLMKKSLAELQRALKVHTHAAFLTHLQPGCVLLWAFRHRAKC